MVVLLALIGALAIGLVAGLAWRGFVMLGDRRQLSLMAEQLNTEHRMSVATNRAIARMRQLAMEHLRSDNQ